MTGRGDAYRRRDADSPRWRGAQILKAPMSQGAYTHAVLRGEYQSDIAYDPHALDVSEHHGGRTRPPTPRALAPLGTVVAARPERRIGFVFGCLIGKV